MPLDPASPITEAEQTALHDLLADFRTKDKATTSAKASLGVTILANLGAATADQCVDLFGDGTVKPTEECTLPPGLVPERMRTKGRRRSNKPYKKGKESERRASPDGVPVVTMQLAETQRLALQQALTARQAAAVALNGRISKLGFKAPQGPGWMLDVFGDGMSKMIGDIDWPTEIKPIKSRRFIP